MLDCWHSDPTDRPTFSGLTHTISGILEGLADYLDVNTFGALLSSHELSESTHVHPSAEVIQSKEAQPRDALLEIIWEEPNSFL